MRRSAEGPSLTGCRCATKSLPELRYRGGLSMKIGEIISYIQVSSGLQTIADD